MNTQQRSSTTHVRTEAVILWSHFAGPRSLLAGLVPLVEKCADKDVTEEKLFALHPDAVAVLYASDLFAAGSGYTEFAARVGTSSARCF